VPRCVVIVRELKVIRMPLHRSWTSLYRVRAAWAGGWRVWATRLTRLLSMCHYKVIIEEVARLDTRRHAAVRHSTSDIYCSRRAVVICSAGHLSAAESDGNGTRRCEGLSTARWSENPLLRWSSIERVKESCGRDADRGTTTDHYLSMLARQST